jgi:hypothetical protein
VRPFVFDHVELNKQTPQLNPNSSQMLEDFLIAKIDKMLFDIEAQCKSKSKELQLPLVRLKIENTGFPVIKSKKLMDYFMHKIANNQDFL